MRVCVSEEGKTKILQNDQILSLQFSDHHITNNPGMYQMAMYLLQIAFIQVTTFCLLERNHECDKELAEYLMLKIFCLY